MKGVRFAQLLCLVRKLTGQWVNRKPTIGLLPVVGFFRRNPAPPPRLGPPSPLGGQSRNRMTPIAMDPIKPKNPHPLARLCNSRVFSVLGTSRSSHVRLSLLCRTQTLWIGIAAWQCGAKIRSSVTARGVSDRSEFWFSVRRGGLSNRSVQGRVSLAAFTAARIP